jgi:proton-translocating NADH-quinone oxidoreductase chain L
MESLGLEFDFTGLGRNVLPWIVLLPLAGAAINGLFGRNAPKGTVTAVAIGSVFMAFVSAVIAFGDLLGAGEEGPQEIVNTVYEWFTISIPGGTGTFHVPVNVRFVMDHLSGIMTVMVTGIATLIHVYSASYMGDDPGYRRFMTYLNLFTASMLILVLASNIPLMFVGWEGVGLCSYLLIGFWWENPAYAAAGRKAFVVNRIGDFGVLMGTFLIVATAHTFEFSQINAAAEDMAYAPLEIGGINTGMVIATAATLFIFLGCTGKSAQLPLYVWLPDAMAGPTPVSALIHAATMVTAGVYLCARLSPLFIHSETTMAVIAVVGALTALFAASIALVQTQLKKILAYSTVSQLGFMFAAVGCGAFGGGIFHVFTHAFFKACLFLGAGSVMHAVHAHGDADIRYLGGLRKYMPRTHITFALSCAAIAGVPLTSGFFSKDDILFGALESVEHLGWVGYGVFGVLAITAFLTAFYMFRLYFRTFWGEFKGGHEPSHAEGEEAEHSDDEEALGHAEPHESDDWITTPLMILAGFAMVVGFLGIPHWLPLGIGDLNWWGHWMSGHDGTEGPVATWALVSHAEVDHGHVSMLGWIAMGVGTLVGLGGIFLAYSWYGQGQAQDEREKTLALGVASFYRLLVIGLNGAGIFFSGRALVNGEGGAASVLCIVVCTALLGVFVWGAIKDIAPGAAKNTLFDKWRVDEAYDAIFVRPLEWFAIVSANIDRIFVDGLLTKVPAEAARLTGWLATRAQNGVIYAYATLFAVGTAGLVWWFVSPHTELTAEVEGASVHWAADVGAGYQYRWDFDSDGEPDTEWGTEAEVDHAYASDGIIALVAVLEPASMRGGDPSSLRQEIEISARETVLPVDEEGGEWTRRPEGDDDEVGTALPEIELHATRDGATVWVHANSAAFRGGEDVAAEDAGGEEGVHALRLGETATMGPWRLRIAARVQATVEVRSAFGAVTRDHEAVVVEMPPTDLELAMGVGR